MRGSVPRTPYESDERPGNDHLTSSAVAAGPGHDGKVLRRSILAILISAAVVACTTVGPESVAPAGDPNDPGAPAAARLYLRTSPATQDVSVEIGLQLAESEDPGPTYGFASGEEIRVIADAMPGTYRASVNGVACDGAITLVSVLETDVRLELDGDRCIAAIGPAHPLGDQHTID